MLDELLFVFMKITLHDTLSDTQDVKTGISIIPEIGNNRSLDIHNNGLFFHFVINVYDRYLLPLFQFTRQQDWLNALSLLAPAPYFYA